MPLGLDSAARERVLAAGSFEAAFPDGSPATDVPALAVSHLALADRRRGAGDSTLIELVDRLYSCLDEADAANRRLQGEVERAQSRTRKAILAALLLSAFLIAGMFAVCLTVERLRAAGGIFR